MNKKLVAAALGLAFAAPVFADDSDVTLYGRIHQAVEHNTSTVKNATPSSAGNGTNIADVASRLGVRGKEDLGGGLSAIFAYEFGVDTDSVNSGASNMSTRHAYAGLKGGFGTLVIGSQDGGNDSQAPLYNQASAYALNVNNNGGQLTVVNGGDAVISRQQRVGNSIGYATTVAGVKISARHALTGTDAASGEVASQENKQRQTSIAADYTLGNLTFGGGYERRDGDNVYENAQNATLVGATGAAADVKSQWQLGAKYQFSFMTVAGLVGQQKYFGNRDSDTQYSISGLVPINASMGVQALYAVSENGHATGLTPVATTVQQGANTTAETDNKQFQVSAYYDLSKRTRSYVGFNRTTRETNGNGTAITKTRDDSIVLGLRHNF
jgi:predicted porin